jgi:DNA invertase Pin-like site-specific DNA recombinase
MKVALYARYSSDIQRDASITDQFRLCRLFADRQAWTVEREYSDHAITGSTLLLRPGIQRLMQDAMQHRFDVLLAESLDRFSRDQEDTAGLFKRLRFLGVSFVTLGEGEITELHVGFKGTMNALYLKDLADKTRRGLRGRVEAGKSGGGRCYGYRVVRSDMPGIELTGEREVDAVESEVVRRIFRQYVAGTSPKAIAHALNRESIPGPFGGTWSPSTIHGNPERGTGILNNELYVGRLVWNRLRYVRDPDTGKRVSRLNPAAEWITADVPHLRIVPDDVWQQAKARQAAVRRQYSREDPRRFNRHRRPTYLFSGLTKCGVCGGGYVVYTRERLGCFSCRARGTCSNRLTIAREEVETRVLHAIRDQLMRRDFFEEFCREYTREMNRLRTEHRASLSSAERELVGVKREIGKLIDAIKRGVPGDEVKDDMIALGVRRKALTAQIETADATPPLLHPQMADVYRERVTQLCQALQDEGSRTEAQEAIRQLVEAIVLEPEGETLAISLKGDLAGMLAAAQNTKKAADTGDLLVSIQLVAGARNHLYRTLGILDAA